MASQRFTPSGYASAAFPGRASPTTGRAAPRGSSSPHGVGITHASTLPRDPMRASTIVEHQREEDASLSGLVCCAVLCCAVLCCAVLCCAVLCCAALSFALLLKEEQVIKSAILHLELECKACKAMSELRGCAITKTSDKGHGTRFCMLLCGWLEPSHLQHSDLSQGTHLVVRQSCNTCLAGKHDMSCLQAICFLLLSSSMLMPGSKTAHKAISK